jgi:HAD superfamily hydrolase (TIGR01459 family)
MPILAADPHVPVLEGLNGLADSYDGVILDLWGVVHDGVAPFPGVVDALAALRAGGRRLGLLSNAPRRVGSAVARLERLGVPPDRYDVLLTSGELTRDWLAGSGHGLGDGCLYIGPEADAELLDGLALRRVDAADAADFLLVTGFADEAWPVEVFDDRLAAAAARNLPLVCANPDRHIRRDHGALAPCAGLIADRYRELGGRVVAFGKPDADAFRRCRAALGLDAGARIVVIGDSLETDIAGARAAGMDAVLVARGVHAEELGVRPGEAPRPAAVEALCARHGVRPDAVLASLRP